MKVHIALREGDGDTFSIKPFFDFFLGLAEDIQIIRSFYPGANGKVDATVCQL
jgi:hypothetical protein